MRQSLNPRFTLVTLRNIFISLTGKCVCSYSLSANFHYLENFKQFKGNEVLRLNENHPQLGIATIADELGLSFFHLKQIQGKY